MTRHRRVKCLREINVQDKTDFIHLFMHQPRNIYFENELDLKKILKKLSNYLKIMIFFIFLFSFFAKSKIDCHMTLPLTPSLPYDAPLTFQLTPSLPKQRHMIYGCSLSARSWV